MSALFAEVLVKPPFLWGFNTLGYVFTGQIVTAVAVPIVCGYFSDQITKLLSKRNNGVSEVSCIFNQATRLCAHIELAGIPSSCGHSSHGCNLTLYHNLRQNR